MTETNTGTKKKHHAIYVIQCKDTSLLGDECTKLINQLLQPGQKQTGLFDADPKEVTITEVLDELRTLPFLTDKRVVVIKNADKFITEHRPLFEKYFDDPCPTGILVLTVNNWDSRTKLFKKLPQFGKLLMVTLPNSRQLPGRLTQYACDAHNKKLTFDAANLLIELTGDELPRLYSEIDKLATFAQTEKAITAEHIESLIGHNRLFNAFAVIDSAIAGNIAGAIDRLRKMFAEDRSAGYTFVGALAFHFRRMFEAKALLEKGVRPDDISKRLRIWSNQAKFFAQLRKVSLEQIGGNLQRLTDTDYAIKTGRAIPKAAAEQLIFNLAAAHNSK